MTGCFARIVETASPAESFTLALSDTCGDALVVEHYTGDRYATDERRDHVATVDLPQMRGGYSDRGGTISNEHDPAAYKVIRLRVADRVLAELSPEDLRALPHDRDGHARVPVDCARGPSGPSG